MGKKKGEFVLWRASLYCSVWASIYVATIFQWLKSTTGGQNNQIRENYNGQIGISHHFGSFSLLLWISLLSNGLFDSILEHFWQIIHSIRIYVLQMIITSHWKFEIETSFTSILPISPQFCIYKILKWKSVYSCVQW